MLVVSAAVRAPDVAVAMFLTGLDRDRLQRLAADLPQTPSQALDLTEVLARLQVNRTVC